MEVRYGEVNCPEVSLSTSMVSSSVCLDVIGNVANLLDVESYRSW